MATASVLKMAYVTRLRQTKISDSYRKDSLDDNELTSSPVFNNFIRPCLCEFLGTATYVFLSCMSGFVLNNSVKMLSTALVQGLSLTYLMLIFGHISGAHFNPAVTVGVWIGGGIRFVLAIFYIICQMFGGFIGAVLVKSCIERESYLQLHGGVTDIDRELAGQGQAILLETMVGSALVLSYLMTAVDTNGSSPLQASVSVGLCVFLGTIATFRPTAASFNLAKTVGCASTWAVFGPEPNWRYHYIYWISTGLCAPIAAGLYRVLLASDQKRVMFKRK